MAHSAAQSAALRFDLPGPPKDIEPYGAGHINETYRLAAGEGPEAARFILQRINTTVFRDPAALMENVVAVTAFIEAEDAKRGPDALFTEWLRVIPTKEGRAFLTTPGGAVWRAYNFIEGGVSFQTAETPALLAAAARAYGRFARLLGGFDAQRLHETIPRFHDTPRRLENLRQAAETDPHRRAQNCADELAFALAREADCAFLTEKWRAGALPTRVTHNDTKLNNVLINPETLEGVCVIDLDTVMPGLIHNDFGDAIRTGATTAAEDEADLTKVSFSLPLYRVYLENYLAEVGGVLTPVERETLPWGARLMTLECGVRFLEDYLRGDVYFKTHRPGQNLDRARVQFKLVADMEEGWGGMQV